MNNVTKLKRVYTDYKLDRSANDLFFYDGRTGEFGWVQDQTVNGELESNIFSLNESDYFNDDKLVKEIKEFKAYVKKQLKKGV